MSPLKDHWLPLGMRGIQVWNGFIIQLTTDVPCHIWLRWTANRPHIHKKVAMRRGIALYDDLYYCFTTYGDIDQNQPGDTTRHTYHFAKLEEGVEYWFYHWGYIEGNRSKSCSPILPIKHTPKHYVLNPDFTEWSDGNPWAGILTPTNWTAWFIGPWAPLWIQDSADYINPPWSLLQQTTLNSRTMGIDQKISSTPWAGAAAIFSLYCKTNIWQAMTFAEFKVNGTGGGSWRKSLPIGAWSLESGTLWVPEDSTQFSFRLEVNSPLNRIRQGWFDALTLTIPEPIPA